MEKKIITALSIAGSDSSSGAGIQADLKAFAHLQIYGLTVLTCVTSQNTQEIQQVYQLPVDVITNQIDVVYNDFKPAFVKTGMLYNADIVKAISEKISQYNMNVVIDPVMVSTTGQPLTTKKYGEAVLHELLSKAFIITPNLHEAEMIVNTSISSIEDMKMACKKIVTLGPKNVVITGGHHSSNQASDVFYNGKDFVVFTLPKIPHKSAHGSGCTFSALLTGLLAKGRKPEDAVGETKHLLWNMIHDGLKPGKGIDVVNPFISNIFISHPYIDAEKFDVWVSVKSAVEKLSTFLPYEFIPEVGNDLGFALPNAKTSAEICAIDGRIQKTNTFMFGNICFGASKHISSIIRACMSYDPSFRSVMNIKYSKQTLEGCKKLGLSIGMFDRSLEPKKVASTMEWGTKQVISKLGFVPDIIYDLGGVGKEPMIRVIGKNPADVVNKIYHVSSSLGYNR